MNRAIKFRVFAKVRDDDGCIGYLETQSTTKWAGIHFFYDGGWRGVSYFLSFPDVFIVQQFTGLTDTNGKEIYEGDIVKTTGCGLYKVLSDGQPEYTHGVIKFFCSAWKICQRGIGASDVGNYTCCDGGHDEGSLEIVGNIFETPELLS